MNKDLFSQIIAQAPDGIILSDIHGNIKLWNEKSEEIFGHHRKAVMDQSLDLIIPERLREAHWKAFRHAIETGVTKYHGKSLITKSMHQDGRTIYVTLSFSLMKNDKGEVVGALAFVRDFTEEYLREKEELKS